MIRPMRVIYGFLMAAVFAAVAATVAADSPTTVQVRDDCDPTTFNLPPPNGAGPGVCDHDFDGDTTFGEFVDELTAEHSVEKWRFNPGKLDQPGTVVARNRGGETHTFTNVVNFGGGIIPFLNTLSGNPTPAAECLDAAKFGASVVPSGGSTAAISTKSGDKYQCCIHPWMRMTVR